ncbi:hypothetical protein [Clostridium magnum]|nr:hypothetical protein [Clostridium magnum]
MRHSGLGTANELRIAGLLYMFLSFIARSNIELSTVEDKKIFI